MKRIRYLVAECLVVGLFIVGVQVAFLYFLTDFGDLLQILAVGLAVLALPLAVRLVLLRPGQPSLSWGFYNPVRPIAALRQSGLFEAEDAGRLRFAFDFEDPRGRDSIDVVSLLAGELQRQGIRHANTGSLRVKDGGSEWVLEPSLDLPRVSGWVRADSAADRQQIVSGIRDFVTGTLGMRVSECGR